MTSPSNPFVPLRDVMAGLVLNGPANPIYVCLPGYEAEDLVAFQDFLKAQSAYIHLHFYEDAIQSGKLLPFTRHKENYFKALAIANDDNKLKSYLSHLTSHCSNLGFSSSQLYMAGRLRNLADAIQRTTYYNSQLILCLDTTDIGSIRPIRKQAYDSLVSANLLDRTVLVTSTTNRNQNTEERICHEFFQEDYKIQGKYAYRSPLLNQFRQLAISTHTSYLFAA